MSFEQILHLPNLDMCINSFPYDLSAAGINIVHKKISFKYIRVLGKLNVDVDVFCNAFVFSN